MSVACFKAWQSFTSVQELNSLITASVGTSTATKTHAIDPRISVALDIIQRVCDGQETLVQDMLRQEQGHKVWFKYLHYSQFLVICVHDLAVKFHLYNIYPQKSSIIAQLVFLLDHLVKNLTARELPVAKKTMDALTEICFGNFSNQEIAIQGQVVVSINCLLEAQSSFHLVMQDSLGSNILVVSFIVSCFTV